MSNWLNQTIECNNSKNLELKAKVLIWHILIAKVFLLDYFQEYYSNFYSNYEFDSGVFLKSVQYIDNMFMWDNYAVKYSNFDTNQDSLQETKLNSLKDSFVWDIIYIIWKKDEDWNLVLDPYDLKFLDNPIWISIVKNWIKDFLEEETQKLKELLSQEEVGKLKDGFLWRVSGLLEEKNI